MKTIIQHRAGHDVVAHQLDDADRARACADLIDRLMPVVERGIHLEDDLTLAHEAARLDALPGTPLILRMRAIVAAERAGRTGAVAS